MFSVAHPLHLLRRKRRASEVSQMDEAEWMDGRSALSLARHSQINHIDRRTCGGALLQTVNALVMVHAVQAGRDVIAGVRRCCC